MKSTSPSNLSRTSKNWARQGSKQKGPRMSLELAPNSTAANFYKNEQAGSIGTLVRKISGFNPNSSKKTANKSKLSSHLEESISSKRIHEIQEEKKETFLRKYSKENLMKSLKKSKMNIEEVASNQQANFISKVIYFPSLHCVV